MSVINNGTVPETNLSMKQLAELAALTVSTQGAVSGRG